MLELRRALSRNLVKDGRRERNMDMRIMGMITLLLAWSFVWWQGIYLLRGLYTG